MSKAEAYIRNVSRYWVWGGYHDQDAVEEMLEDVLEEDVDRDAMIVAVAEEFARKAEAEQQWPPQTDCDRLDKAFIALDKAGVCAVQNAGYTQSDGLSDVAEAMEDRGRGKYHGYCFFHGQDLERAIDGHGLMIAFGAVKGDPKKMAAVAREICEALTKVGFSPVWGGDPATRINIPNIDWKRRY